jgi:hypothetical protein
MRKILLFIIVCASATLTACGESSEDAYQRGYEDGTVEGVDEVCFQVGRIASNVRSTLRSRGYC